ncbi:MAG: DUF61 family protein [Candidatus Kariarchaeaceae archaeon]|jgi:uncharacterized protein (UPF0216 family)
MSDKLSRVLKSEIDKINLHLPKKVISLKQLQLLEQPGVYLRDGHFNQFEEEELTRMKELIPQQYWGHILLPIILTRRKDLGEGAYSVSGSDANLYIILQLFEDLPSYDIWRIGADKDFTIYKYNLRKIKKELNSTTVIGFT